MLSVAFFLSMAKAFSWEHVGGDPAPPRTNVRRFVRGSTRQIPHSHALPDSLFEITHFDAHHCHNHGHSTICKHPPASPMFPASPSGPRSPAHPPHPLVSVVECVCARVAIFARSAPIPPTTHPLPTRTPLFISVRCRVTPGCWIGHTNRTSNRWVPKRMRRKRLQHSTSNQSNDWVQSRDESMAR